MKKIRIVLDTNCLLASISSKSENYRIWKGFQQGLFVLCVSNEILEEYEEIIAEKANAVVAGNIIIPKLLVVRLKEFLEFLTTSKE